jgi:hypothetical protein
MSHFPPLSSQISNSRKGRKLASGVRRRSSGLAPAGVAFGNHASYHFPAAAGRRPTKSTMDDPRLRWRGEGAPGQVWRPGSRPALLGRPEQIPGVPSRPNPPAQPLALDVGSPRAAQAAGTGCFFRASQVCPIQPARPAHKTHARSKISRARLDPARFANGRWPVPFRGAGLRARRDRR